MSISFAATPQSKEAQQARTYTDPSAGAPPSRRSGYNAPYVDLGHWNKVFTDQNYFDSIAKQKGMTEGAKVSLHGDDYVYRQAMIGYLADTRKVPLDDMRSIFDAEKDGFAKTVLGKQTASAREMFDWQKSQFERSNEKKAAADQILQGVIRRSLEDALSGGDTPFVESVGKDINAASEMFDDEEKSRLWEKAEELDMKIRASQDKFAPEARFIFDALQQSTGQKTGFGAPDMREMASRFAQLPDNQRKAIYELAGGFAQITQTDKGFWYQMAESLGRGASDIVERVPRNFREQTLRGQLRLLNSDQPVFRATGVAGAEFSAAGNTPVTPEEREEAKAKIQSDLGVLKVERELRDLAERVVDPIKTIGVLPEIIEEGLYGAARSIPYTAVAAVPIAGVPAVASALFSSNYDRIMLEYPDLDPDKAALLAAISAPIEAGLERMKVNTITGRLPVFGGLVKRLQHPSQRNITRIAIGGAGIVAEQNVQEIMQNATFPFVQTIAAALDADMPDYDWEERLAGMPRELAVQFVALLPLSLMGVGALSYREISRGENYLKSKADLEKAGYNAEQIDRITGAESAEAAQATLVEEHAKRDPKLVKAAAQRIVDESIALREKANPAALPRLEKQGADYVVLSPEGKELARERDQTAAEQALVSARRETVQREMRGVTNGINLALEFINKANEARSRGEDIQKFILENRDNDLFQDYEANPTEQNLERLFETVTAFGFDAKEPEDLKNFPVLASNQGALRDGIYRSIVRIFDGADGTIVMRDFAQDNLKRAMAEGRVSIDWVRSKLNELIPQIDSERIERKLRTDTDTDVIEAFSDVAIAYFRGRITEDMIPEGFRGFFRRMAVLMADIFRRSYRLARLRAEGKLDRDFEALLAETIGLDQQAIVDRSREKTAQEVAPEVANYSIGVAPNGQPSNLSDADRMLAKTDAFKAWGGNWEALEAKLFLDGNAIIDLQGDEFPKIEGTSLVDRVAEWFRSSRGNKVTHPILGVISIDRRGARDSIAHGLGRDKAAAFAAVPHIIEQGRVLDETQNYRGTKGLHRHILAAPISLAGQQYIGVAVVQRDEKGSRFYLHEVGLKKKLQTPSKTASSDEGGIDRADAGAIKTLIQDALSVNPASVTVQTDENGEPLAPEVERFRKETNTSNYSIAAAQEQRKADVAITPETPVAKSINGVSAEEIFASAKERFGITNSIYEAGYVLPDGTMLDFSGRSQASGYKRDGATFRPTDGKSDYFRDSRGIDHREIEWDGMPEYTETWGSMADFLRLGAVRIDGNSGTISMRSRLRPTSAQLRVLKDLVTSADGAYLDLEDDLGNGTAMMLESGKWTRVHGFLERWANGETPATTRHYSISTQSEIDRVGAALDRLARSPSERISQYAALKERLTAALERNKPIMQSMRGDMLPQDFDRTRILNDLGFLDYILKVLPPEVRGRVGGYTNLASIAPVDVYKGDQKVSEAKNPAGAIISAWMREGQNIGQAQKNTALPEGYSTVPNTTDERRDKTIANFLIDRLKKIDRELERYYKRDLMERIFDVLDKSRPKAGQSGVKRSTLGAETQKFADMVYRSSLLDDEKTAERLAAIEAQITSTEATADSQKRISELSEEWTIVNTFGDLKSRPSETLAYGLDWLQTQLKAGREAWQIKEAARIQENRERAAKVIAFLGKPTDFGRFENKSALQRFLQAVNAFDLDHKSFDQFAPYLFGDEVAAELSKKMQRAQIDEAKLELENTRSILAALRQGAKAAGVSTSKALVAFKENQPYAVRKMEGRKVRDTKISIELAKKIVRGLADRGSLSNQDVQTLSDELAALPRDTKKEFVTIKQVIFRGEEVRLTMSRAQAMQLWLTWQQSDAQEKMRADGFTDDSFDDLDNLISGPFAQAILRVTSRIYGSGYALTNPIYARMFGMNMPMVRNYAPARYLSSKEVKDVGLDGSPLTAGGQPSFAKSRVNHTAKLAPEDALTVLQSHIAMQSHWVAFAEVTREYRSLLSNPDVRESIRQRLGADVLRTAEMWGDQMEQRGGNKGREIAWINNMLGAVIGGQSVSLLGYNLKSLMMQTDNLMRFTLALDSRQIGSALSDPVALMQNIRKVWKTDIIQTRLEGGATAETRFFFERFVSMFRRGAKVAEMSMMPMNYLDSAGLSVSGAIVYQAAYKDALDSGVDPTSAERAAKDAVEAMVYRYGQPVLMGQKSNIENSGNAFTKAFFLFMSDPRLKMAIISDSVRGLATGRGDWKTHVRRIVAIEMMAVVSHVLATAFRDATSDDEDEDLWSMGGFARALLLAPFQGYFLLGSVSDLVLSRLTEAQWFTPTQNPLIRTADTAFRAFNNLDDAFNFDDPDALVKEWTNITRSIAVTPPLAAPAVIMNIVRPLVQGWERMDDDE